MSKHPLYRQKVFFSPGEKKREKFAKREFLVPGWTVCRKLVEKLAHLEA